MPIYEYEAVSKPAGCHKCVNTFEAIQGINESPLTRCPNCGQEIRRIISWCHAAVTEKSEESTRVEKKVNEYEKAGMWSHAAELADKHSEKTKDRNLKTRAMENYKKAGYNVDSMVGGD